MTIPFVDLKAQYGTIKQEIDAAIRRVIERTDFIHGEELAAFEDAFARYLGVRGAVGVASGTAALHLSLLACGIGPGDEVITPAHTCIATAEAISHTGAHPVFVDVDPKTYTLNPACVQQAITSRTKAVIPVHLYGHPADMRPLMECARRHSLWVIEDAAQAHGALYQGQPCGSLGHVACFSFFPGKVLGAYGDAGAVTGNDEALLARVRRLRNHGRSSKYAHEELGFGERLDTLQAAILLAKLPYLDSWVEARRSRAKLYTELLSDTELVTPIEAPGVRHAYHLYVVRTSARDRLIKRLKTRGIEAGIHYPIPLHRQPAYAAQGYGEVSLPVTEQISNHVLSLPIYPELQDDQVARIVEVVKDALTVSVVA